MNVAILCNGRSDCITDRVELIADLQKMNMHPYVAGIDVGTTNGYYTKEHAVFIPIEASRSNTNPLVEIKSIFSVKKQMKAYKIDAVIIYGVKNHAAMAIGARLGSVKKILCVVNGSGNLFRIGGIKGRILRFMSFPMLKIAYAISSEVCFQNNDDKELFIQKKLIRSSSKVFLTGGSGANLSLFPERPLPKENRFLFLARITPSKGIKEYIEAAAIVKNRYPEVIFDIVGPMDGVVESGENKLLETACKNGLVRYHGATDKVSEWIGTCRFFAYPSYYPEGVPRCAIQAIATGRPIITCMTPGCKETVINGVNGFLIPAENEKALADKMIWMIEHPESVEKMAAESRKYAELKFDVHKINKQLIDRLV